MTKFKVGDEVILNKIENKFGDDNSEGYDLPMRVRITRTDSTYDYAVNTLDGEWLAHVLEKNLSPVDDVVVKQTNIVVTEGQLSVQHTTNSKRSRVGLLKQGRVMGHIRFEEIDQYIDLLTKLKEEV